MPLTSSGYTRPANSYSTPVANTAIDPVAADALNDDLESALNTLAGNVARGDTPQTLSAPVRTQICVNLGIPDPGTFAAAVTALGRMDEHLKPVETWSSVVNYAAGRRVSLSGTTYEAIQPSLNVTPPNAAFWFPILAPFTGGVLTSKVTFTPSTASIASFNIPSSATDPTSPVDGDIWRGTGGLVVQIAGASRRFLFRESALRKQVREIAVAAAPAAQLGMDVTQGSVYRITGHTSAFTIQSFAGVFAGQELLIINAGSAAITLENEATAETQTFRRINTGTGANVAIAAGKRASLIYDELGLRWLVTSVSP